MLYCQFAVDKMEVFEEGDEFVRKVFKCAVMTCEQHVNKVIRVGDHYNMYYYNMQGGIIWDDYREFETAILSSLQVR